MKYYLGENLSNSYYIDTMLEHGGTGNVLFSYASCKDPQKAIQIIKRFDNFNIIIDSGAFSVWNSGGYTDLDKLLEYYKILYEYRNNITFISLDVIPAKKGQRPTTKQIDKACKDSLDNYKYLKQHKLNLLPVFHQHDNFKYLDIYKQETDYICISPANDCTVGQRILWLDRIYANLKAEYKTHSLAGTANKLLQRYPFYSCDSINWKLPTMWGQSKVEKDKKITSSLSKNVNTRKKTMLDELDYYKQLELDVTKLWEKRGVKWD